MTKKFDIEADELAYLRIRRDRAVERPAYADIIATDGRFLRRVAAAERQIVAQHVDDGDAGTALIDRVENGLERGRSLVGYSLLDDARAVCVRLSGDDDEHGWLAYRDERPEPPYVETAFEDAPRSRLVAGALPRSAFRDFHLLVAVEQRGDQATELVDSIDEVSLHATRPTDDGFAFIDLARHSPRPRRRDRQGKNRLEMEIPLSRDLFDRLVGDRDISFWLEIEFSPALLPLPPRWRRFWLLIRPR